MRRVVVTGMGAITPIGNSVHEYWQSLLKGKSGAASITRFAASRFKTKFACEVKGFEPEMFLTKAEIRKYDLFTLYALASVDEAVGQANLNFESLDKENIGVIWGAGDGGVSTFEEQVAEYVKGDGTPRFNPYFIPKRIINMAAGVISIRYGLRGINFTTAAACAASNTAIIEAFNYIHWGKADVMITGGSEASITESSIGGFNAMKALSTRNDAPENASRPFDVDRDGFVLGEGAGALILESYEHALARNATILAEIVGGGLAADAYHLTGTHPEGLGAYLGMQRALKDAGLQANQIDYINAHATSTLAGDSSELEAISRLFSDQTVSISSTKSMTGHLLGGAGAIEAVACVNAVREDLVPPKINTTKIENKYKDRLCFPLQEPIHKRVNYAMNNTFGFGGQVAITIFKKFA